jgi:hypothetical protein
LTVALEPIEAFIKKKKTHLTYNKMIILTVTATCRYQKKCDELEVKNNEFRHQFEQLEENKKDIVAFIRKKLDEKSWYISSIFT